MHVTFLGTGTSHGIPVIGCDCAVCVSRDSRDKRTRASVAVETQGVTLLVDASPELRLQLLSARIKHVDALLATHAHADHIGGLDDVRIFSERSRAKFPVFGPAPVLNEIRERFAYVFHPTQKGGGKPRLWLRPVAARFRFRNVSILPIPLWHGRLPIFGYRIGTFAYLTDVSRIPESSYPLLRGLSVLVLDALRPEPHATHFHLARALEEARRIGAPKTYFTHLCHLLGHRQTSARLPAGVRPAYDGLRLELADA